MYVVFYLKIATVHLHNTSYHTIHQKTICLIASIQQHIVLRAAYLAQFIAQSLAQVIMVIIEVPKDLKLCKLK